MRRTVLAPILILINAACATVPPAVQHRETYASDGLATIDRGATVPVPAGWTREDFGAFTGFVDPENSLSLRLIAIDAGTARDAIDPAWKRTGVQPGEIAQAISPPASQGWDEVVQVTYKVPPELARVRLAVSRRKGNACWVALLEGAHAGFGRRGGQVNAFLAGLVVPGVVAEALAQAVPRPLDEARTTALAAFVEEARSRTKVPGLAVAVVQDGRIVFARGFGTTRAGGTAPVGPGTNFLIGSVTKSMTSFVQAREVERGRVSWDAPLAELAPRFRLADEEATRRLTLKHSTCACTGLPRRDVELLFDFAKLTPDDVLASLSGVKPTTALGETFQYSNQLAAIGGYALARRVHPDLPLGEGFEAILRADLFDPAGMTTTTSDFARGLASDHADPHSARLDGTPAPLDLDVERFVVPYAPAGAVWSNAEDMARYALVELANGVALDGTRLLSEDSIATRRRPMVKVGATTGYGLGLITGTDRGVELVRHNGGTFGFASHWVVWPGKKLGLVVLANVANGAAFGPIEAKVLELVLGAQPVAADRLAFSVKAEEDERAKSLANLEQLPSEAFRQRLAGTWQHPRVGSISIADQAGTLVLDAGEWKTRLARLADDGVEHVVFADPPFAGLSLRLREDHGDLQLVLETDPQEPVVLLRSR